MKRTPMDEAISALKVAPIQTLGACASSVAALCRKAGLVLSDVRGNALDSVAVGVRSTSSFAHEQSPSFEQK